MTNEELDALQALCDGARPGPWTVDDHTGNIRAGKYTMAYDTWADHEGTFIAASRTAMPELIGEVRRLTSENQFLRKAYRDKVTLNRVMASAIEQASNLAEGPYKDFYDRVTALPDCNTCGRNNCEYRPVWGLSVRINCPLWRGPQQTNEDNR